MLSVLVPFELKVRLSLRSQNLLEFLRRDPAVWHVTATTGRLDAPFDGTPNSGSQRKPSSLNLRFYVTPFFVSQHLITAPSFLSFSLRGGGGGWVGGGTLDLSSFEQFEHFGWSTLAFHSRQ